MAEKLNLSSGTLALAVTWEAKPGEGDRVAELLARMADAVHSEPGTLAFLPHRSPENEHAFFLYERFVDDAAFAAHQQTPHFKSIVLEQALPRLARRERVRFMPFDA